MQWLVTVGVISSASVGHGTHKLASWPFVMMYEHVTHTIWRVGQNYNEAPVFTSKSAQTLFNCRAGQLMINLVWE